MFSYKKEKIEREQLPPSIKKCHSSNPGSVVKQKIAVDNNTDMKYKQYYTIFGNSKNCVKENLNNKNIAPVMFNTFSGQSARGKIGDFGGSDGVDSGAKKLSESVNKLRELSKRLDLNCESSMNGK